jgi:predicted dehydrogenase
LSREQIMVQSPVSIVLVGIGGMGGIYVRELLDSRERNTFRIAGAVDPEPGRCPRLDELRAAGVPIVASLEAFYRNRTAELAIISSPIQFHADQTSFALARGSHVLCEKPVAGTIEEARRMMDAERAAGRRVSVGYQWSFSPAVQALKTDIMAGLFGRPRRLKCLYLWPRDEPYYARNDWAGKKRDAAGRWILDGPAQNAMAHDLHNMFYVLGRERAASARPSEVEAELCRAYPIENHDTAAVRARTEDGVEILLYVTHVPRGEKGPHFAYEFERAVVRCSSRTSGVWAEFLSGERKDYGVPDAAPMAKLWEVIRCVRSGESPACGLEAASSQTLCVNGMEDSMPAVLEFPAAMRRAVEEKGARRVIVDGLDEALEACYEAGALPSELGFPWSERGRLVNLGTPYSFPHPAGS